MIAGQLTIDDIMGRLDRTEPVVLDHAAFAHANRLSGPRQIRDQPSRRSTGLDRPARARPSGRCHCDRWSVVLFDGSLVGEFRCVKCGRRP